MFESKDTFKEIFLKKYEQMHGKSFEEATPQEQYSTLSVLIREHVSKDWIATNKRTWSSKQKQVYYFSIEFLLGRLLGSNLLNLGTTELVEAGLKELGVNLKALEAEEIDAGLGNGGLGRLAACFLDSLASIGLAGHGIGLRYKHGFFQQRIIGGYQVEGPEEWLKHGNPWEVRQSSETVEVKFGGRIEVGMVNGNLSFSHQDFEKITAIPYEVPIVGYKNQTINTLRLWSTEAEGITDFLYPDDTKPEGKILRLKQQYFLVSAGLQSIIKAHLANGNSLSEFQNLVSIHINDTHPVLAIPELMRILLDDYSFGWEEAWQITNNTISFTNHTTLSEALERWPISIFKPLLPRIYMIVEEINRRFQKDLWKYYHGEKSRIKEMSIIGDGEIRMAHLAIVGSHSINGVAKLHTEILKQREMRSFFEYFPGKFNNKTNGITHRRWLLKANPKLSRLINEAIGEVWIKNPQELKNLENFAKDASFLQQLANIKLENKLKLVQRIKSQTGFMVDESSIFDVQIKRLHAYKRQLLNVIHIMYLYNRLKEDQSFTIEPRTFIFGAKASPAYHYAKKIIKLINTVGEKINQDPQTNQLLKVIFLENYQVSLAEEIIPAADISEQISTASKEASGTGNMKMMMNGALTIGTLDGANIEILEAVGKSNIFTFGLTAEEVMNYYKNGGYSAFLQYQQDPRLKKILDQLINGFLQAPEKEFRDIYNSLVAENDQFFVLKDFSPYVETQENLELVYKDKNNWFSKCTFNIANSGIFSSDRTILEYTKDIWGI